MKYKIGDKVSVLCHNKKFYATIMEYDDVEKLYFIQFDDSQILSAFGYEEYELTLLENQPIIFF